MNKMKELETRSDLRRAIFAGGCFWCMQPPFDKIKGVVYTAVGYTGGHTVNPTYEAVCSGTTGHAEAVLVFFDPQTVGYAALLDTFWRNIDPTNPAGQFADRGTQYRTAIFYADDEQKKIAEKSKSDLAASGKFVGPIVTEITAAGAFYPAEEYHQAYYQKNFQRYDAYKKGSGRAGYLEKTWGAD